MGGELIIQNQELRIKNWGRGNFKLLIMNVECDKTKNQRPLLNNLIS